LEELDPVVCALQREIQSGKLKLNHIFYKVLVNALEFSAKSDDPRQQFSHNETVLCYAETLEFHGKDKVMNLLRGPGFRGQGKCGKFNFQWKDWNLLFVPGKSTRQKIKSGYTTKSGVVKSLLTSFLLMADLAESGVTPLIEHLLVKVIPVCLATDGMSLKPGLEFDSRLKELVGLKFSSNTWLHKGKP
jgi:hypothetical protein